jgi:lysophospholipase L1-like esterase
LGFAVTAGAFAQDLDPAAHGPSFSKPVPGTASPFSGRKDGDERPSVATPSALPQPLPITPSSPLPIDLPPSPEPARLQTQQKAHPREYQSSPTRQDASVRDFGPYAGPFREKLGAKLLEDFGEQYIYAPVNAALPRPVKGEPRVVFIGDSITDKWELSRFFPGKPYVNRGIGSQITPQMLVRFHADVIALKPKVVVIAAGINDVTGLLQIETEDQIKANYQAMAELASAHGIKVIFASILPINNYTDNARNMLVDRKPETLKRLNAWLKSYCARMGFGFIDYTKALSDQAGLLRAEFTSDGLHPNEAGYKAMAPVARSVIDTVLSPPVTPSALKPELQTAGPNTTVGTVNTQ